MTGHGKIYEKIEGADRMTKAKNEIKSIEIKYSNGEDYIGFPSQGDIVGIVENLLNYLDTGHISTIHFETAGRLITAQNQSKKCPGCGGNNTRKKRIACQNDLENTEDYCDDCEMFFFIIRQKLDETEFVEPDNSPNQSSPTCE
ncbi:hypothetical protein CEE45_01695 [Candidatus Heimdallarchaeota archaeon B3_Heim]|nr:MAG: hypothetical protein CEE45_01695 [Candidatus Heimdallarchaeota archaeon B3_Heim]